MELDRALELAVVSSWHELAPANQLCSIHVEYKNLTTLPVKSLEVWMIQKRGYGMLVCRCSESTAAASQPSSCTFENSYRSKTLADDLDFIIRNQSKYSRPADHSIHGFVQVSAPSDVEQKNAKDWSHSGHADLPAKVAS